MNYYRLILIILCLSSSSTIWAMGNLSSETSKNSLIGKAAPDVVLSKSDGTSASVIASNQGQKVILLFWATWCPHCYEELGAINDNFTSIEQKGFKIVLVDIGESREEVQKYFDKRQMRLVSFLDEDSTLQEPYHLAGVPTIVFIDEKGIIRSITHTFPSDYANYFSVK